MLALIPQLERRKVFERPVVAQLRRQAIIETLRLRAPDLKALRDYWDKLAQDERLDSRIAGAAAAAPVPPHLPHARPEDIGLDPKQLKVAYDLLEKWTTGRDAPVPVESADQPAVAG